MPVHHKIRKNMQKISINTRFGMNPAAESGVFLAKIYSKIRRKKVVYSKGEGVLR